MLGIIAIIAAVVAVYRIALVDGENATLWAVITLVAGIISCFYVLNLFAGAIAFVVGFLGMFLNKVIRN